MPFQAPKQSAFKQFVILDADGVVSALSAIDGGQVDEILTRSAEQGEGSAGGELGLGPAKARGKKSKTRKVEEEIRKARTRHATAAKLLEALHARESIGVVDGPLDLEVAAQIQVGMVLEFRAELLLHPLHQADQMLRSLLDVGPKFGQELPAKDLKEILKVWGVITGTGSASAATLLQPTTTENQLPRLLMPVPAKDLEVKADDVLGEVTIIAQVERILDEGQDHQVIRLLRGGPATPLERNAIEETLPGLVDALNEMSIDISEDDIVVHGPALLLRAICAYR